jgi:hypothetical protein
VAQTHPGPNPSRPARLEDVVSPHLPTDPRHGTHEPTTTTPSRLPRSVRRTTTMDACYPEGPGGRLVLKGRGRDLITDSNGAPSVAAAVTVQVGVEFRQGPTVMSIATTPHLDVQVLVGRLASSGFRAAIDADTPAVPGTLTYLLLDEVPATTLVGGYSIMRAVRRGDLTLPDAGRRRPPGPPLQFPDLCAGWQTGGVIMTNIETQGAVPHVTGPKAPAIEDPTDPWSWHDSPPLAADTMRRRRRIDVTTTQAGTIDIDAFYRDSHMTPDGYETVIHEYTVNAAVNPTDNRIISCGSVPRVLPWIECPQAAGTAGRLAGTTLAGLRHHVRAELVGPATCTHLNDTLRALEDTPHLVALLPPAGWVTGQTLYMDGEGATR